MMTGKDKHLESLIQGTFKPFTKKKPVNIHERTNDTTLQELGDFRLRPNLNDDSKVIL